MYRKSALVAICALIALLVVGLTLNKPLAQAQNTPVKPIKPGELQLKISNDEGVIPYWWTYELYNKDNEKVVDQMTNTDGGLLRFPNLKPGEYELFIKPGPGGANPNLRDHAPVRVMGLIIEPGKPRSLSVILHKGLMLETIGKPVVDIPPAIIVSEEIEKMQKRIAELEKQIAELKKK